MSVRADAVVEDPDDIGVVIMSVDAKDPVSLQRAVTLRKLANSSPLVVLMERASVSRALELLRRGVSEVIDVEEERESFASTALNALARPSRFAESGELIGQGRAWRELQAAVSNAADFDSTVLLQGETGTGKGLVARLIHQASARRDRPLIHVDCGALSPALIESELFGHERGAFTGAHANRTGRFELARNGTIFLDEIGDVEPAVQGKLLRVLQDRYFERVGGTRSLPMQARVIAATSRDLREEVERGTFRRDLYYRLNVLSIGLLPLRARRDDIPALTTWGLTKLSERLDLPTPRASDELVVFLQEQSWRGNVRELLNVLERALTHTRSDRLEVEDVERFVDRDGPPLPRAEAPSSGTSEEATAETIRRELIESGGNVSRVARRLGLPRGTLRYRIRKHGLDSLIPRD